MKFLKNIILLSLILLIVSNCKRESDPCFTEEKQDINHYVPKQINQKVPYTGRDTFTYLYTTPSDTSQVVFKGVDTDTLIHETTDCKERHLYHNILYEYESIQADTTSNSPKHKMEIELRKKRRTSNLIDVTINNFSIATGYYKIKVNQDSLNTPLNTFHNVYKNENLNDNIYWSTHIYKILKFNSEKSSKIWYLIPKK